MKTVCSLCGKNAASVRKNTAPGEEALCEICRVKCNHLRVFAESGNAQSYRSYRTFVESEHKDNAYLQKVIQETDAVFQEKCSGVDPKKPYAAQIKEISKNSDPAPGMEYGYVAPGNPQSASAPRDVSVPYGNTPGKLDALFEDLPLRMMRFLKISWLILSILSAIGGLITFVILLANGAGAFALIPLAGIFVAPLVLLVMVSIPYAIFQIADNSNAERRAREEDSSQK